jgi:hypothetical protein
LKWVSLKGDKKVRRIWRRFLYENPFPRREGRATLFLAGFLAGKVREIGIGEEGFVREVLSGLQASKWDAFLILK